MTTDPDGGVGTSEGSVICSACGTLNAVGQKFCGECAAPLALACPTCGAGAAPGQKFCGECASPLGGAKPAPTPGAVPIIPGQATVAERRLVSVLFADIVGFTPFAESRDAEEVRETLTRYFDTAAEVVARYGGTVEKFIGDAVMAVWGTPIARGDDAERAVRAALDLVDAVRVLGPAISARAGVLTGEAAVTLGATNQGMVAGDLVNTAARLQSAAAPGMVLVGEATHRAASGAIAFEPAGEQSLKGKAAPVAAWVALRVVAERGGRGRSDALEAPFVGRDDELRLIKDLFHATTRERRPRLVSVTGIGGIGKSRLAWEFEKYLDGIMDAVWWHHGRSPAYGEGVTFWPLGEMIRSRAGVREGDDEATTRTGLGAFLDRLSLDAAERSWVEPALLAVLGIGSGIGSDQLFGAWRTFFERLALTGTVVLVFEDLHWADSGTLDFIEHLLDWSRTTPLYIVTLSRPELLDKRPSWGAGRRNFTSLFLEPLAEPAMRALLAGLVPGLPASAADAIVVRAEGVPLYAVETVRMLVADGKLALAADGRYEPRGDLTGLAVPDTLTALIAARLDALDAADRALILDAAVLGQSFSPSGLAAVAGVDEASLADRLRSLVRRELLVQQADPRSPERGNYAFVQALIREVAYNTLARRDRKTRHLAAARYFEVIGTDEIAGALSGHLLAAHGLAADDEEAAALAARARLALASAADRARALGAFDQSLGFTTSALAVTTGAADRAVLQEQGGGDAVLSGRLPDADRLLRQAIAIYRELGDLRGIARSAASLAYALTSQFRLDEALALLEEATLDTATLGDEPGVIELWVTQGRAHYYRDEPLEALSILDRALATAERRDLVPLVAQALMIRGSVLGEGGRSYEGQAVIDGARRLAEAGGLEGLVGRAITGKALLLAASDPVESRRLYLEAAEMARRRGDRPHLVRSISNAVEAAYFTGDWAWAERQVEELLAEELLPPDRIMLLGSLAATRARRGEDVDPYIEEQRKLLEVAPDPSLQTSHEDALGFVAFSGGRMAEARAHWRRVCDLSPLNAPAASLQAGMCSVLLRDTAGIRSDLARLDATGAHGPAITARRLALGAGIDALEGHADAARAGFRDAATRLDALGLPIETAVLAAEIRATLGADDPAFPAACARAHQVLDPLSAVGLLRLVDDGTPTTS